MLKARQTRNSISMLFCVNELLERVDKEDNRRIVNSTLLYLLIPSHLTLVLEFCDGKKHAKIERFFVDFAAETKSALVIQSCFSLTNLLI